MLVYLVRHGETDWNRDERVQGWSDIPLNEAGVAQAIAIGRSLGVVPIRAVYSSPLRRALDTAAQIAAHHALPVLSDPDLRELNQGILDGLTPAELRSKYETILARWVTAPALVELPGGESMLELQLRAWQAIQRIAASHLEDTVAIVSHNLAILAIICRLLELDLNRFRHLRQEVAAINLLEIGGRRGDTLIRLNDTSHLIG